VHTGCFNWLNALILIYFVEKTHRRIRNAFKYIVNIAHCRSRETMSNRCSSNTSRIRSCIIWVNLNDNFAHQANDMVKIMEHCRYSTVVWKISIFHWSGDWYCWFTSFKLFLLWNVFNLYLSAIRMCLEISPYSLFKH